MKSYFKSFCHLFSCTSNKEVTHESTKKNIKSANDINNNNYVVSQFSSKIKLKNNSYHPEKLFSQKMYSGDVSNDLNNQLSHFYTYKGIVFVPN